MLLLPLAAALALHVSSNSRAEEPATDAPEPAPIDGPARSTPDTDAGSPEPQEADENTGYQLLWDTDLPALPVTDLGADGLSGLYAGKHRGAMLVLGGSYYAGDPPWQGGEKKYLKRGWFLFPDVRGRFRWRPLARPPLPQPLAHGVSISTPWGLVVAGGNNNIECSPMARLLSWDGQAERLVTRDLPPLPQPLTRASGALLGSSIYLVGGEQAAPSGEPTRTFLQLDLGLWITNPDRAEWRQLPAWDGPARSLASVGVSSDGNENSLFVFGGRGLSEEGRTLALNDAHKFTPSTGLWSRVADIAPEGGPARGRMAAAAAPGNRHELLLFGGDDHLMADVYHLLSERSITSEDDAEKWRTLNRAILEHHPGYPREILAYHAVEDRWRAIGSFPSAAPLANPMFDFAAGLVLPGGEISPGRRTNEILRVTWENRTVIRRALPARKPAAPEAPAPSDPEDASDPPAPLAPRLPSDDPDEVIDTAPIPGIRPGTGGAEEPD